MSDSFGSCDLAVESWVREREYYRGGTKIPEKSGDKVFEEYGHWTQLVWSDTREVGCCAGMEESERLVVWVCEYWPAGNVQGRSAY